MVVESKIKRQVVGVMVLSVVMLVLAGCGGDSAPKSIDQALSNAVLQLEIYGHSRSVSLLGCDDSFLVDGASGKSSLKKIKAIDEKQQSDFDDAFADLKKFADEAESSNVNGQTSALAKWVLAAMELYRGEMAVAKAETLAASNVGKIDQVLVSSLKLGELKGQKDLISPDNYTDAIAQSKEVIARLGDVRDLAKTQLEAVSAVVETIEGRLEKALALRDEFNLEIGDLASQISQVSADKAVELQSQINDIEAERFYALIDIETLEAGPLKLSAENQIEVGDRKLETVRGLKQLEEEAAFLTTRLSKAEESIAAQQTYLTNLQQQMTIADDKGRELTGQLDTLSEKVESELDALNEMVASRSDLRAKAQKAFKSAARYAQQAESDLKGYLSAVNQAGSSGASNPFLTQAKTISDLTYSIANVRVNAQLGLAKLDADDIYFAQQLADVLKACKFEGDLPDDLSALVEQSEDITSKEEAVASAVETVVKKFDSLYKGAGRGDFKSVVGTQFSLALYKASLLVPQNADEYLAQAGEILGELVGDDKAASTSADLAPARRLKQLLGL